MDERITREMIEAGAAVIASETPSFEFSNDEKRKAFALALKAFFEASTDPEIRSLGFWVPIAD